VWQRRSLILVSLSFITWNGSVARSNELNHQPIERGSISIASIEPSHRFLDHRIHGCASHRSCYRPQLRGISIACQGAFERLNYGGRAFPVGRCPVRLVANLNRSLRAIMALCKIANWAAGLSGNRANQALIEQVRPPSSVFAEMTVSPIFLPRVPEMNPRTECACHAVAVISSLRVTP
jgi:hypothetical protein